MPHSPRLRRGCRMTLEYLIAPGHTRSKHDGQVHYVDAPRLARLYGLRPGQWRTYDPVTDRHTDLPVLTTRYDGDYRLLDGDA